MSKSLLCDKQTCIPINLQTAEIILINFQEQAENAVKDKIIIYCMTKNQLTQAIN